MVRPKQNYGFSGSATARAAIAASAIAIALTIVGAQPAQAQTFNVLHTFTGGHDGANPQAGVTLDKAGNLYGTAANGGGGYGTVYQLKRKESSWVFNPLFSFNDSDGANPVARVIFGPDGSLYGTTASGGNPSCDDPNGCGTVFKLRPFPSVCKTSLCPWTETVLYDFRGSPDGDGPGLGDLIFDQVGNIFGTTFSGGTGICTGLGCGTVFELTPSGNGWTETPIYAFSGNDGEAPENGVIFDNAGNLYSTTFLGGLYGGGTVFELTYSVGSGWTESLLYSFRDGSDGSLLYAGLIFDQSGNLYGATSTGGSGGGGTVFELSPSGSGWTFTLLYSFAGPSGYLECGPNANLVMDGAGNLYGTTRCDGANNKGSVFRLTSSGPPWTYSSLHDFTGGNDGASPTSNVVFDSGGNLFGTASQGGDLNCGNENVGCGVVWEITP